jgi:predicted transcriptional regulator
MSNLTNGLVMEVKRVPVRDGNTRISVTLSKETHEKLQALAQSEHRSVSAQAAFEIIKSLQARKEEREGVKETAG